MQPQPDYKKPKEENSLEHEALLSKLDNLVDVMRSVNPHDVPTEKEGLQEALRRFLSTDLISGKVYSKQELHERLWGKKEKVDSVFSYQPARKVNNPKMYSFLCKIFGNDMKPSPELMEGIVEKQRISWFRGQPLSVEKISVILGLDPEVRRKLNKFKEASKYLGARFTLPIAIMFAFPVFSLVISAIGLAFNTGIGILGWMIIAFFIFLMLNIYENVILGLASIKNMLYERYSPEDVDYKEQWGEILYDILPGEIHQEIFPEKAIKEDK